MLRTLRTIAVPALCLGLHASAHAQQSIGTVGVSDATVSGALDVTNGRAVLRGASTVTAKDHTAEIALNRGGSVKVCATSGLHVTAGKGADETPLLLALDRGAVEVATQAGTSDVLMTPDLRFTLKQAGPLDLRLRVARNGDTCVENRGGSAPTLTVADQFGEASYEVHPGQHLLFEHGSLKEVVDHESEPCGCPPEPVVSVADSGVTSKNAATPGHEVAKSAAEQHPFPAAVSAGLSPASSLPPTPQGQVHAQVSSTMSYGTTPDGKATGSDGAPPATPSATGSSAQPVGASTTKASADASTAEKAQAPPQPPAPSGGNVFRSIGHFFKRLFGGG